MIDLRIQWLIEELASEISKTSLADDNKISEQDKFWIDMLKNEIKRQRGNGVLTYAWRGLGEELRDVVGKYKSTKKTA